MDANKKYKGINIYRNINGYWYFYSNKDSRFMYFDSLVAAKIYIKEFAEFI